MGEKRQVNCKTVGGSLVVTPLTISWIDRVTIVGINATALGIGDGSAIGPNLMFEEWASGSADTELPDTGDKHPTLPGAFCSNVEVRPAPGNPDSPNGIQADITWLSPHLDRDGNTIHSILIDNFQQQEIRNFDTDGKMTGVPYYRGGKPDDFESAFPPWRIADIRVPRTIHGMRIVQYENVSGLSPAGFADLGQDQLTFLGQRVKLPVYNLRDFLGYPPHTLLYLGRRIDYQGIPIARVEYDCLVNDRGWNKFSAVYTQQNGYVPKDLKNLPTKAWEAETACPDNPFKNYTGAAGFRPTLQQLDAQVLNGIGIFDMLDSADLSEIMPNVADVRF